MEDKAYVKLEKKIDLQNDLFIGELRLPEPVYIELATNSEQNITTVTLSWTKASEALFREYKLYRHTSPGLDESTGELIYLTTNIDDKSFSDHIERGSTYYYRVFILSQFDKMGGSNIINTLFLRLHLRLETIQIRPNF